MLSTLIEGKGRTVMMGTLRNNLKPDATDPDGTVRVYMSEIRASYRAVAGKDAPDPIQDMDGQGYQLSP
jgi:DNA-binding response OmpR family regulator